jgi:hypothetical protein
MTKEQILSSLCVYDERNPYYLPFDVDDLLIKPTDCSCDNCFYGRTELTEQLIWQAKRMYTEEEVLNIIVDCDGSLTQAKKWFEQFKKK